MLKNHFLTSAKKIISPNYNKRPYNNIYLIVIHSISLPPNEFNNNYIEQFFINKLDFKAHPYFKIIDGLMVSAHLLIKRDGIIIQFVPFNKRAWHAGKSSFRGKKNCNDFSIGIELQGSGNTYYKLAQYKALNKVIKILKAYYPISAIVGHSDISIGRKKDPGPTFNWSNIHEI